MVQIAVVVVVSQVDVYHRVHRGRTLEFFSVISVISVVVLL